MARQSRRQSKKAHWEEMRKNLTGTDVHFY